VAQDWDWRNAAWGAAEDGRGSEAERVRSDSAPRPRRADCVVEAPIVDGRLNGSGCDEPEWENVLQELRRPEASCLGQ
jgi:hypothetical protein